MTASTRFPPSPVPCESDDWTESSCDTSAGPLPYDPGRGILTTSVRERFIQASWFCCAIFAVVAIFFIFTFLFLDGYQIYQEVGFIGFLTGVTWNPTGIAPSFGTLPLIVGTLLVTLGAMVVAVPLGIGSALAISEIAPSRLKAAVKPAVELLAGIPSVVYGFFGLILLTDWLRIAFDLPTGSSWLAGSILLGIMALPTIISVSEDAISAVPREFREGSLALGATHWQTISRVIVPSALSGITAAIILGMGRAIGETMAVLMVTGNAAIIPSPITNIFSPIRTLTGTLGIETGEVPIGSMHYHALFGVALLLLLITLLVNMAAVAIMGRLRERTSATVCRPHLQKTGLFDNVIEEHGQIVFGAIVFLVAAVVAGFAAGIAIIAAYVLYRIVSDRISPKTAQRIAFGLLIAACASVLAVLAIIIGTIVINGAPALSPAFILESPRDLGRAGGIFPAIIGTLYLVAGAIAIALPIGIGAAIYFTEYSGESRLVGIIRSGVDLLNGTPSIVFGLFGFAFLVLYLNFGISLLAGQIALGLMVLPTIIRTTEEALKCVPNGIREGSLALGATKWQTIRRVVLPVAVPGILTGTILSVGRAAGETAPIMFTAVVFSQRFLPSTVFSPVMALPYHLFILTTTVPGAETNKYGTALVLLLLVISIYSVAIYLRNRSKRSIQW